MGHRYRGCGEQADTEITALTPLIPKLDDLWTFQKAEAFKFPFYHQWVVATSNNPNDPIIVIDPWEGAVATVHVAPSDSHVVK